jgi:hypothetical protein
LGAAQERASEAETSARAAAAAYRAGDPGAALSDAAAARERTTSVGWWLSIAAQAPSTGGPLDADLLNRTARDLADTAREEIVYAQVLLQEAGGDPSALQQQPDGAQALLDRADADIARGFVPAAVFEALRSDVSASVALELAGVSAQDADVKVARAHDNAAAAIVQARSDGLEPILAQSYFEFAGDQTDATNALTYYNTARSVALLGQNFFTQQATPTPSRFVGFDSLGAPAPRGPGAIFQSAGSMAGLVGAFVFGVIVSGVVAIAGLLLTRPKQAPPPRYAPPPAPAYRPEDAYFSYPPPPPPAAPSYPPPPPPSSPPPPPPEGAAPPAEPPRDEPR